MEHARDFFYMEHARDRLFRMRVATPPSEQRTVSATRAIPLRTPCTRDQPSLAESCPQAILS
eukprot:937592-Prymnesium_polylepis.1